MPKSENSAEGEGYLLSVVTSFETRTSSLFIFDANAGRSGSTGESTFIALCTRRLPRYLAAGIGNLWTSPSAKNSSNYGTVSAGLWLITAMWSAIGGSARTHWDLTPGAWRQFAELGWLAIAFSEAQGGIGGKRGGCDGYHGGRWVVDWCANRFYTPRSLAVPFFASGQPTRNRRTIFQAL